MIFRQPFEDDSSTYTYLLGCRETSDAGVLVDFVLETVERDLSILNSLGLPGLYGRDAHSRRPPEFGLDPS
jgi:sulfur dioxygenase